MSVKPSKKWWVLKVIGMEWFGVLDRLIRDKIGDDPPQEEAFVEAFHDYPKYYITKQKVSAADLSARLGVEPKDIEAAPVINLHPIDPAADRDLPKPTVPYSGRA